jgi:hypothetical protein
MFDISRGRGRDGRLPEEIYAARRRERDERIAQYEREKERRAREERGRREPSRHAELERPSREDQPSRGFEERRSCDQLYRGVSRGCEDGRYREDRYRGVEGEGGRDERHRGASTGFEEDALRSRERRDRGSRARDYEEAERDDEGQGYVERREGRRVESRVETRDARFKSSRHDGREEDVEGERNGARENFGEGRRERRAYEASQRPRKSGRLGRGRSPEVGDRVAKHEEEGSQRYSPGADYSEEEKAGRSLLRQDRRKDSDRINAEGSAAATDQSDHTALLRGAEPDGANARRAADDVMSDDDDFRDLEIDEDEEADVMEGRNGRQHGKREGGDAAHKSKSVGKGLEEQREEGGNDRVSGRGNVEADEQLSEGDLADADQRFRAGELAEEPAEDGGLEGQSAGQPERETKTEERPAEAEESKEERRRRRRERRHKHKEGGGRLGSKRGWIKMQFYCYACFYAL